LLHGDLMVREDVLRELERTARKRRTVTYGHLMKRFRMTRGRGRNGVVHIIGEIDLYENKRGGPGFGAIVVRKDTGYPGGGYFCYDDLPVGLKRPRKQNANPRLSYAEKEHIKWMQKTIWDYYRKDHSDD
jgi:hypothetical protein